MVLRGLAIRTCIHVPIRWTALRAWYFGNISGPCKGYVLAFPVALVVFEGVHRLLRGFIGLPARIQILDETTFTTICKQSQGKDWRYQAGQYIFLQVPSISIFQWHPCTISMCECDRLQLHVKCEEGGWTERLRDLPTDTDVKVGISKPFGAPAHRFCNSDRSVRIDVTPWSAVRDDIEQQITGNEEDLWRSGRRQSWPLSVGSRRSSRSRQSRT